MPDQQSSAEALARDLRDTRAALIRAREEIRELRAENEALRAAAGPRTVQDVMLFDADARRAAISRGDA